MAVKRQREWRLGDFHETTTGGSPAAARLHNEGALEDGRFGEGQDGRRDAAEKKCRMWEGPPLSMPFQLGVGEGYYFLNTV
ncbi:hypothetical protein S83_045827 [Arachis hypogaea]